MIRKLINYLRDSRDRQRINIALAKGGAMMNARNINLKEPASWEFSGFSQNGEDGIIDILRSQLLISNRYFIEIGSADGIENNSAWMVVAERYSGLMVEGDPNLVERAKKMVVGYSIGAECYNMFITKEKVQELKTLSFHENPDVFSLDIDGNDYYIAKAIFDNGFRPKIFVVEYNAVYGAERSVTIEYSEDFYFRTAHVSQLYYGVSIRGWRNFFESHGYHFVTVDRNGVNGFFVDPEFFDKKFLNAINPLEFAENLYQFTKFRMPNEKQFSLIENEKFVTI